MIKEWPRELQVSRKLMWLCRLNQQKIRKAKESGSTIKVEVGTTIRVVEEISTKKMCQIREDHTKATKEVVL